MQNTRKILYLLTIVFIYTEINSFADVELPTYTSLKEVKTIYEYSSKQENNLLGDGYYGKVVSVAEGDMKKFIDNLKRVKWTNHQWINGALKKYKLHLKILEHIEKFIKDTVGNEELERLNKAINLKKLKKNTEIYHRIEFKENSLGITDAQIWILIPEKNIVCILRSHT